MDGKEGDGIWLLWLQLRLMNAVGLRLINSAKIDLPPGRFMDREMHFTFRTSPGSCISSTWVRKARKEEFWLC